MMRDRNESRGMHTTQEANQNSRQMRVNDVSRWKVHVYTPLLGFISPGKQILSLVSHDIILAAML